MHPRRAELVDRQSHETTTKVSVHLIPELGRLHLAHRLILPHLLAVVWPLCVCLERGWNLKHQYRQYVSSNNGWRKAMFLVKFSF